MSSVIIAIALWCGNTNPALKNNINNYYVDKCRKQLFECVNKNPNGTGFIQCFKSKELVE